MGPVVMGGVELGGESAVVGGIVGMGTASDDGMVPILHDLGGGSGDTAGDRESPLVVIVGAEGIVEGSLIPCGGHKGGDGGIAGSVVLRYRTSLLGGGSDVELVGFEPGIDMMRQRLIRREDATGGIA